MKRAREKNAKWPLAASWLTAGTQSIVGHELELAKENSDLPGLKPHPAFRFIAERSGGSKLLRALDKLAPVFPLTAYHGLASVNLSPPMSGAGNCVYVVAGEDSAGQFRVVGGNYFSGSALPAQDVFEPTGFFDNFDSLDSWPDVSEIITGAVWYRASADDVTRRARVSEESRRFATMPIFLSVFHGEEVSHFCFPAVIAGDHPSDISLEWAGEVF